MSLDAYRNMLGDMVRDDSDTTSQADQDVALEIAVLKYSKDRPYIATEEVTSDGTAFLDLPPSWQPDFSKLLNVRIADGVELVEFAEFELADTISGEKIKMGVSGTHEEIIYITFTFPHGLDHDVSTIPAVDKVAVCHWAAAYILDQLATQYAGFKQTMLDADAVDWQNKSRDFSSRAKSHRTQYHEYLGILQGKVTASGAVVDLDLSDSRGRARLTHPARNR